MKNIYLILKNAPLFAGLDESETEAVLKCLNCKTKIYSKNELIISSGDPVDSLGLLISGSAIIVQDDFWGNRNLIAKIFEGQIFGESFACIPSAVSNVSVIANESCEVLLLNINKVLTTCTSVCFHHGRLIRNLLSESALKNLRLNQKLTHMGRRTTREKLLSFLSSEAQQCKNSEFDIQFNRQQLADYLAVDRSALSSEIGKLRDEGLLEFNKNHFILKPNIYEN